LISCYHGQHEYGSGFPHVSLIIIPSALNLNVLTCRPGFWTMIRLG